MSRSRWKIPFIQSRFVSPKFIFSENFNTVERSSLIGKNFIDKRIRVYNGRKFISFIVLKGMVGKRLSDFSPTKVLGSKIALSKRLKQKAKKKKK